MLEGIAAGLTPRTRISLCASYFALPPAICPRYDCLQSQYEHPRVRERHTAVGKIVNCIPIENFWLLGLVLDEPGNVWGIQSPPEDWTW